MPSSFFLAWWPQCLWRHAVEESTMTYYSRPKSSCPKKQHKKRRPAPVQSNWSSSTETTKRRAGFVPATHIVPRLEGKHKGTASDCRPFFHQSSGPSQEHPHSALITTPYAGAFLLPFAWRPILSAYHAVVYCTTICCISPKYS